jgi:hypothetical protein
VLDFVVGLDTEFSELIDGRSVATTEKLTWIQAYPAGWS